MITSGHCAVCNSKFLPDDTKRCCPKCDVPYHQDCWVSNDAKCAIYGCGGVKEVVVYGDDPNFRPHSYLECSFYGCEDVKEAVVQKNEEVVSRCAGDLEKGTLFQILMFGSLAISTGGAYLHSGIMLGAGFIGLFAIILVIAIDILRILRSKL